MSDPASLAQGLLVARRDLVRIDSGGATVVKDPLSLEYFRFGERERFLLEQLQRPQTLTQLTRAYRRRFPNEAADQAQVLSFCSSLHECGLIVSDRSPQVGSQEPPNTQLPGWLSSLLNPLAIRLPGVDPTAVLDRTQFFGRMLFSRPFAGLLMIAAVIVGIALVGRAEEFAQGLSELTNLATPTHALSAALAVIAVKTWHEIGHALACRRMGAECHEVGLMLLALMPCLYCDASDAWAVPSRWKRTVVALAGVYFECLLAILAAGAWLVIDEGPLRALSLYVIVVSTISTLLINLNPLLRFDGYYVLSDLWGVANLHEQSRAALWGPISRWIRGDKHPADSSEASATLLAIYGAASVAYSWSVLGVLLWGAYQTLDAIGFRAAGDVVLGLTCVGVVAAGGRSTIGLLPSAPGNERPKAAFRLTLVLVLLGVGAAFVLSMPIEQSLRAPCRLESERLAEVVARSSGRLQAQVRHGDQVEAGDLLAELVDPQAAQRKIELEERAAELAAQIEGLQTRSQREPRLLADLARLQPTLVEVRRQLRSHELETARRQLRAPLAGSITRPALRDQAEQPENAEGNLNAWAGAPLDPKNDGCQLQKGETLCCVKSQGLQALVLLSEKDSSLLRLQSAVRIALDRSPWVVLEGQVAGVAPAAADEQLGEAERRLEAAMSDPLDRNARYRVLVRITSPIGSAGQPGALGTARIVTGEETVGQWILRWARRLMVG